MVVIRALPPNKARGPDRFIRQFLHAIWEIIRMDMMHGFDAFLAHGHAEFQLNQ
jgi:hypothetical protein